MNFLEDLDVGILYLSTKFELDRLTNNGDLSSIIRQESLETQTDTHLLIMNFSEDLDVGILYLSTKFELDWSTNNGDLLSDKNH